MSNQNTDIFLHKGDTVRGEFVYVIDGLLGSGAQLTVYRAHYVGSMGYTHRTIVKECCPKILWPFMQRAADGTLTVCDSEKAQTFLKSQDAFREACTFESTFEKEMGHGEGSLSTNSFQANGTLYSVTPYVKGKTLDKWLDSDFRKMDGSYDLEALFKIFSYLSKLFEHLFQNGFLYWDVSPQNVYIPEVMDSKYARVQLIDFDSVDDASTIGKRQDKGIHGNADFAAPEIRNFDANTIGYASIVFGVSALLFYSLFGRKIYDDEICGVLTEKPKYLEELESNSLRTLKNQPPHVGGRLAALFRSTLILRPEKRKIYGFADMLDELAYDCGKNGQYLLTQHIADIVPYAKLFGPHKLDDLLERKKTVMITGAPGTGKRTLAKYFARTKCNTTYSVVQVLDGSKGLDAAVRSLEFKQQFPKNVSAKDYLDQFKLCKHKSLLIIEDFDDLFIPDGELSDALKKRAEENYAILECLQKQPDVYVILTRNKDLSRAEEKRLEHLSVGQMYPEKLEMAEAFEFFNGRFPDGWMEHLEDDRIFFSLEKLFQENDCNFAFIAYVADKIKTWSQTESTDILYLVERLSNRPEWLKAAIEKEQLLNDTEFAQILLSVCLLNVCRKNLNLADLQKFGVVDESNNTWLYERIRQLPWIEVSDKKGELTLHQGFSTYILATQAPTMENPLLQSFRRNEKYLESDPAVLSAMVLLFEQLEKTGAFEDAENGRTIQGLYCQLSKAMDSLGDSQISEHILLHYYLLEARVQKKKKERRLRLAKICGSAVAVVLAVTVFVLYMAFGRITVQMPQEQKVNYNFADTVELSNVSFFRRKTNITSELSNEKIAKLIKAKNFDFNAENILVSYQADGSSCTIRLTDCSFAQDASKYKIQIGHNPFEIKSMTISLTPFAAETEVLFSIEGFDAFQRDTYGRTRLSFTLSMYSAQPFETVPAEELPQFLEVSGQLLSAVTKHISIVLSPDNTDICKRYNVSFDVPLPCGKYDFKASAGVAHNIATGRTTPTAHRVFEITNRIVDMSVPSYSVCSLQDGVTALCDGDSIAYRIEYKRDIIGKDWPYQYIADSMKSQFTAIGFTFDNIEVIDILPSTSVPYFESNTVYAQTLILHNVKNIPEINEKVLCIPQGIAVSSNGAPTSFRQIDVGSNYTFGAQKNDDIAPRIEISSAPKRNGSELAFGFQVADNRILGTDDTLCFEPNLIEITGIAYEKIVLEKSAADYRAGSPYARHLTVRFENMRLTGDAVSIMFLSGFFRDVQGNPCETCYFETTVIEDTSQMLGGGAILMQVSSPDDFRADNGMLQLHLTFPESVIDTEFPTSAIALDGFTANLTIIQRNVCEYDLYFDSIQAQADAFALYVHIAGGIGMDVNGNLTNSETVEISL